MAILELHDVTFSYPDSEHRALDKINCRIETGRLTALVGSNGCGKSTLARVAAGLLQPQSGKIVISGVARDDDWYGVGLVFQNADEQLLTSDVEGEIAWGLENLSVPADEMKQRVSEVLDLFGLSDKARLSPEELSDGWKQLTALAAVTVMKPAFLLLDEVTAFLDPLWRKEIRQYVRKLSHNTGILWITTDTGSSGRLAELMTMDYILVMEDGRIVHEGAPIEIFDGGNGVT